MLARDFEPEIVMINASLSPVQQRNLEKAWGTKVLDRTALILEIFGERAQTREGTLQVELAHLNYQRSRPGAQLDPSGAPTVASAFWVVPAKARSKATAA